MSTTIKLSRIAPIVRGVGVVTLGLGLGAVVISFFGPSGSASAGVGAAVAGVCIVGFARIITLLEVIHIQLAKGSPSVAPPAAPSPLYFYMVEGEMRGPEPLARLREIGTGETLVCQQGAEQWTRLAEIKGQ